MDRLFQLSSSFGLGYFFGLGAMALTHYLVRWPSSYDEASVLALIPGVSALITRLAGERRARGAAQEDGPPVARAEPTARSRPTRGRR